MRSLLAFPFLITAIIGCQSEPTGLVVSLAPESPTTQDLVEVIIEQEAIDKNGDAISYSYQWQVDGGPTGETGSTLTSSRTQKNQTWTVFVTPSDGGLTGEAATASVTILNSPPKVTLSLDGGNPYTDDNIQVLTETSDADFDKVDVTYTWSVDGQLTEYSGYTIEAALTEKGQTWEVQAVPNDGEVNGETATLTFTVGNTAPEFEDAKITPLSINKGDTLNCVGSGWFDQDGDPEGYLTTWFVNDTEVSTASELPLMDYERNDQVYCELTAFDGELVGNTITTNKVVIQNARPTVGAVVISPEDPVNGTAIESEVNDIVDLDEDEVSLNYEWLVDGKFAGRDAELSGKTIVRGQTIQLQVTPNDSRSNGEPVLSNVLTVANTPPVITDIDLGPVDPQTNDILVVEVTTRDVDRDTVTVDYEWYVNGTKISATGDTLDGVTHFDKNDTVYVIATPSDTESGAAETSATLTVQNTLPAAPELIFDPVEPTDSDDVVCEVDSQAPDEDGDTITYTVNWTVNGYALYRS